MPTASTRPVRTPGTGGLLACAAAVALVLTGCAGPASAPHATRAPAIAPAGLDLLTYSGTYPAAEKSLTRAESQLIASCMTAKGLRYVVVDPASASATGPSAQVDLPRRRSQGYGLYAQYAATSGKPTSTGGTANTAAPNAASANAASANAASANDAYVRRLPTAEAAAYMTALRGSTSDLRTFRMSEGSLEFSVKGCEADSRRRLYGSLTTYAELAVVPQNLNATLTRPVQRDAAYLALMRKWSTCMAAKGYHYAQPGDAQAGLRASYARSGATPALRKREIATAVADGTCALRLRIPTEVVAIRKRLADTLLTARQKTAMAELTKDWRTATATARRVVRPT
ncbi:hypothetical protein [Streptomyces fuscichromogenes]|uniref:Lipoprotein n=1 Tax=Streptomyces fuscichromogenes TaxID=1324013 RepID=A0A917XEV3_9ACTN|nr:hypothetical protein [Streptomyces fuscichromogenes]GGN15011.1 hypothetical protein GCM10011578_042920 [Streptomyces fuscichromogenes]